MELDVIFEWLSWPFHRSLINPPSLTQTVVAVVEDEVSVISVFSTADIKALSSVVLEVLS